jgi:hypothetical protein
MSEKYVQQRSGAKALAIDRRSQLAKIRLLLLFTMCSCVGLALALTALVVR